MGRNNENLKKAKLQGYKFTKQLDKWGLNDYKLILENLLSYFCR